MFTERNYEIRYYFYKRETEYQDIWNVENFSSIVIILRKSEL